MPAPITSEYVSSSMCRQRTDPPKSSFGVALMMLSLGAPSWLTKISRAKGPATPFIESYTNEKSGRDSRARRALKSKIDCIRRE